MTSAAIKLELMERLASVKDEAVIKRIATMLRRAFPEVMAGDGDDITDEEYAAFEEMRAKRLRGEVKFLPCLTRASTLVPSPRSHHLHHQRQALQNRRRQRLLDLE